METSEKVWTASNCEMIAAILLGEEVSAARAIEEQARTMAARQTLAELKCKFSEATLLMRGRGSGCSGMLFLFPLAVALFLFLGAVLAFGN